MYEVLKKGRLHNLSVKCQYDLFDKIMKPILLSQSRNLYAWNLLLTCSSVNCITISVEFDILHFHGM